MKIYPFSEGGSFVLNKLFDHDIEVHSLKITESLYGSVPTIELKFGCSDEEELPEIGEEFTGSLKTDSGYENKIQCYLYSVQKSLNHITMNFLCCKPKFMKDRVVTKYTSIDDAISSTWQLDRLDSVKTDILRFTNSHYIYQRNDTNYNLCTKLSKSYKYNTVFGYTLSGIKFIDLNDVKNVGEMDEKGMIALTQPSSWSDPKLYSLGDIKFIDYNNSPQFESDGNHVMVNMYTDQIDTDNAYKDLIGNFLYNSKLGTTKNISSFKSNKLMDYQLGDFINIDSDQNNYQCNYLSKKIIEVNLGEVKVNYDFQSINPYK